MTNMQSGIIEIIGAPGSGKSTTYNALCRRWRRSSNWVYPGALLGYSRGDQTMREAVENALRYSLRKKFHPTIDANDGVRFIQGNKRFADYCLRLLDDPDGPQSNNIAARYRSIYFLFRDFCLRQAIEDALPGLPCYVDEGFLQKSYLVNRSTESVRRVIDDYMQLMSTPLAVIIVNVEDMEVLLRRIRTRRKIIASHVGMTDSELIKDLESWVATQSLIIRKARKLGISVLEVDGQAPVSTNVDIIIERNLGAGL